MQLSKGQNVSLTELDAELGSITVLLDTVGGSSSIDADVSVLLVAGNDRVRSNDDFVFYNQPISAGGSVRLRDKIRHESEDENGSLTCTDVVTLELDEVPDDVQRIVLAASLDAGAGATFGDAVQLVLRIQRSADAAELIRYEIDDCSTETALLFGEIYRRAGGWRVRAVGQGYIDGLAGLATDYGVDVAPPEDFAADEVADRDPAPGRHTAPDEAISELGVAELVTDAPDSEPLPQLPIPQAEALADAESASAAARVTVRRPVRAPRLPADWNATIPANDDDDWTPARLFPTTGAGGHAELEGRATSVLLSVIELVREFGRAITVQCGAPAGVIQTFTEVPFATNDTAYRPDGAIRVRRAGKTWTALVEVKTGDGRLDAEQIDHYVEIARNRGFDAVVTISSELTGPADEHPVYVDRRKLRKVRLIHLSWDQIRTNALMIQRHSGVADPAQRRILAEFLRYAEHEKSGMKSFTDMGDQWVRARDDVKSKALRVSSPATTKVSARFDQLIQHIGLHLSSLLGVPVQAMAPRTAPDNASRCQQLADSGLLHGSLRVPGAMGLIVLRADLRADRVSASILVDAPRDVRTTTKISWLLRALPETTPAGLRIEAMHAGGRGSTMQTLGMVRKSPELLVPPDGRDIRSFEISLDESMGTKRSGASGTLVYSLRGLTVRFYADVVQNLRPHQKG